MVFANWLSIWDLRSVKTWDLATITVQFLFAVAVYLTCVLVGPKTPDDGPIDLEDFFWRQRRYLYGALLACVLLALIANLAFLKTANARLFVQENAATLPMLVPTVLGLVSRARWAQWAAGLSYLAMVMWYTIVFCSTLS